MEITQQTKSGHFYKIIPSFGTLIFSPYTGLTYAITDEYSKKTINWLNGNKQDLPIEIISPLEIGWSKPLKNAVYSTNHLLPNKNSWKDYSQPDDIITINWFLTGQCNFKCSYCYASDLMYDFTVEPSSSDIDKIAKNILSYNPLYVVLTGGEPFVSPHIEKAISLLANKTGIIIDTNGSRINEHLLQIIKNNKVIIRISLDSPRPKQNLKHRIPKNDKEDKYNAVLRNITKCIEMNIPIIIQTVISSQNKSEILEFGDILVRMGVNGWRIQKIQESRLNTKVFKSLMLGRTKKMLDASNQLDYKLKSIIKLQNTRWKSGISLQISMNSQNDRNSVILVSPNGEFWTESQIQIGKNLLDNECPKIPKKKHIFNKINKNAHFSRYLNIN